MNKLTTTKIKYLKTLYALHKDCEGEGIKSIEVARKLDVTRPSVHSMMEKLRMEGYIRKSVYGSVHLTEIGKEMGRRFYQADR